MAATCVIARIFQQQPECSALFSFLTGRAFLLRPPSTLPKNGVSCSRECRFSPHTGGQAGGYGKAPPNYICNRCNIPGHWKRDCPTKDDPAYDPKKAPVVCPAGA